MILDDPQPTAPRAEPDPTGPDPHSAETPPQADASPHTDAPPPPPRAGKSRKEAPGLRDQIGSTRDSAKRLFDAHLELARAEFEEIGDAVRLAAILGGVAIGAVLGAALLATVGTPLFLGEWIFGSIGWGLLHGLLLLVAVAITAVLAAVGTPGSRLARGFGAAVLVGLVVGLLLGLDLTNRAWAAVGDSLVPAVTLETRPLVAALVVLPIVLGVLAGLLRLIRSFDTTAPGWRGATGVGARVGAGLPVALFAGWLVAFGYSYTSGVVMPDVRVIGAGIAGAVVASIVLVVVAQWRAGFGLLTGLTTGVVVGVVLALMTAIAFGGRVGAAIGVTTALVAWPALLVTDFAGHGIDTDALKERFIPRRTIDMTKETIEWARERMPLSRKS